MKIFFLISLTLIILSCESTITEIDNIDSQQQLQGDWLVSINDSQEDVKIYTDENWLKWNYREYDGTYYGNKFYGKLEYRFDLVFEINIEMQEKDKISGVIYLFEKPTNTISKSEFSGVKIDKIYKKRNH